MADATAIARQAPKRTEFDPEFVRWLERNFDILQGLLENGASGSFTAQSGETITVTRGIITSIT